MLLKKNKLLKPLIFKYNFMSIRNIFILLVITFSFYSCDEDPDPVPNNGDGFNRSELLDNVSNNIIIPAYEELYSSLILLEESANLFVNNPDALNLENLSIAWLDSYKLWQHVEMFDIGLAEVINYKGKMNIYPTDIELINNNILNGNYDLNNNNNFDARGFPAIDFMLHGLSDNNESIISIYINNSDYSDYLLSLVNAMIYNTNLMIEDWSDYKYDFVNSSGNTATSSVNKITNDFIFYFEKGFRANKFGIPAGIFSIDPLPQNVEAFYKKNVSKELAQEALLACQSFFWGKHFNSDIYGTGLATYLDYLHTSSENNLTDLITEQFVEAENKINQLDNNFVFQIENNNNQMLVTYNAIQAMVVTFKVDVLQALAISVDYVDADGD